MNHPITATLLSLAALGMPEVQDTFLLHPLGRTKFKPERDGGAPVCRSDGKPYADSRGRWYIRDARGTIRRTTAPRPASEPEAG